MWTLALLIPVLYVNQEMVLRLGAVTGVGHARLIFERFGKFWGAFSVIDLFLLNALTIVTEFIGISLALDYLGLNKAAGVDRRGRSYRRRGQHRQLPPLRAVLDGAGVRQPAARADLSSSSIRRSAQVAHDFVVPQIPAAGKLSDVMLLIIAIVGTTVAPWQLFFQQSYVIDKRITPRFIRYERLDLWLGIALVIVGAVAMMAFTAAAFAGTPGVRQFHRRGRHRRRPREICRPRRRRDVRHRAHRRGADRRLGGVAVDRLCHRRRVLGRAIRCTARSRTPRASTRSMPA